MLNFRKGKAKFNEWWCLIFHRWFFFEPVGQNDDTIIYQCTRCKETHIYAHKRFV